MIIVLISGCEKQAKDDGIIDDDKNNNMISERDFYVGIAGLVPANYPKPSNSDWTEFFSSINNYGEVFGDYVEWNDNLKENVPSQMLVVDELSKKNSFTPMYAIGFKKIKDNFFKDEGSKYKDIAVSVAKKLKPKYLALGVEVNTLYEDNAKDFDEYVKVYKEAYDEIKKVSPETNVFPIFQLEYTKGNGKLSGRARNEEWFLIGKFENKMDLIGFTTYPMLDFEDPTEMPADYYEDIKKHTDKKVAFTEIAWLSGTVNGRTSSEKEQAEFLDRFLELTKNLDKEFVVWTLAYDLNGNNLFSTIALRKNNGEKKEVYNKWMELKNK